MKDSYYWDLTAKKLAGKTTDRENRQLENWINEAEENKQSYQLQKQLWENSPIPTLDFDQEKRWQKLLAQIKEEKTTRVFSISPIMKIAASVVLLLGLTFLIKYSVFDHVEMISVKSPTDQKIKEVLPDNSIVWLNAESELRYPKQFSEGIRKVELEGEAFFEVTKDPSKPFVIEAQETQTKVLGTSFNISANEKDQSVVVSVATGKVSFESEQNNDQALILLAGDQGIFDKKINALKKIRSEDDNFLAWKSGILKFENTAVIEVIEALEDYYKTEISFENLHLASCKITTTFQNQPIDHVLRELEMLLDIEIERRQNSILLKGSGCK